MNANVKVRGIPLEVTICGRDEIDEHALRDVTHMLSIDYPGRSTATPRWFKGVHAWVHFHDVESKPEAAAFGAVAPDAEQVRRILEFGKECVEASHACHVHLLVHCMQGAGRSPAAAYAILCQALGEGNEERALAHVLRIREQAFPNKLVVKHADALLLRKGRMLEALRPLRAEVNREVDRWVEAVKKARFRQPRERARRRRRA